VIQDVVLQIRKAVRDIDSAQGGIVAAQRQQDAAAEQLRAERIKLEYGESTPFDVLQREEVLVEAEQGLISAFQTYRSSITFLDRSQGTILRNRNISIDAAGRLR
jgi:outer membrane protein TolC